jgi:putative ABC transport system permease protein
LNLAAGRGVSSFMDAWLRDLRFALRFLGRNRGTTVVAVAALALGIGATTAIFSIVHAVLFRPLPYPDSERIVGVYQVDPRGHRMAQMSEPNFEDLEAQNRTLDALALYACGTESVAGGTEPVRATVAAVTGSFFRVLGVQPERGRLLPEGPGAAEPTVVVSHAFWRNALGAQADLSRLRLRSAGRVYQVIGVLPPGAQFPAEAEIYFPKALLPRNPHRTGHNWIAIGRLRPDVPLEQARADLRTVAQRLRRQYGDDTLMADAAVLPLREALTGRARGALLVLLGSVGVLLLAACANVANLLLAQAAARERELAVRMALGAGRARLLRQLVTEALLLCAAGGGLGVLLAFWGVRALSALAPGTLPRSQELGASLAGLLCALAVGVLTALGLGLVTAWRSTRETALSALADRQRAPTGGPHRRLLDALVASQVAATMALLIAAGLLGRSLHRLLEVDLGFRSGSVVAMDASLPPEAPHPERVRLQEDVIERLRTLPGVHDAGLVNIIPLGGGGADGTFLVSDREVKDLDELMVLFKDTARTGDADFRVASEGYFRAFGIPLHEGRLFEPGDGPEAPHVAVVSESFARGRWFQGRHALGQHIQFGNMDGDLRTFTIVGVVGDIREASLDAAPRPVLYASHRQRPRTTADVSFVVHADGDPGPLAAGARRILRELAPDVPPRFRTIAELRSASVADRRLTLWLLAAFGASALALAALGIYGVASYAVARRTREVGIRMALGAEPRQVLRMVLAESGRPVAVGALLGLGAALAVGRYLAALLYEVRPADPLTIAGVAAVLAAAALGAGFLPARRATRVDPAVALRSD